MQDRFEQIAFSGGGIRCFWHGGFMSRVGGYEDLRPSRISGVSGGALSAAAWIGGREDDLFMLMNEAFEINASNIALKMPNFTPHQEIYRAVVETTLDDAAIARIADGPDYQVSLSVPPQRIPPRLSAVFYIALYQLDQLLRSTPHLRLPTAGGLRRLRVDAREAARNGTLHDLICAAATIPPVFDVPRWGDCRVLDGGMLDKAPPPEPDKGQTLVLLTSRYRNLPDMERRVYVQPSSEVAADKIDFSDAAKVGRTWEQGVRDGTVWMAEQGGAR